MTKKNASLIIPLVSILLGFALGAVVLVATGRNPASMFLALFQGVTGFTSKTGAFNPRYVGEFLIQSMPIILTGLSVGFAFRVGLFTIGA